MNTLLAIILGAFLVMLNPILLVLLPFVVWIVNRSDATESTVAEATGSDTAGGCIGSVVFIALMAVFFVVAVLLFGVAVADSDCPTMIVNQMMGRCP